MKIATKIKLFFKGATAMMINYFALQIEFGWITLEQVPKRFRKKVKELIESSNTGLDKEDTQK